MVYKFKVLSDEDKNFYMEIEILAEQTLYDLHDLIQNELDYDRSHLASFFVANHSWKRLKEIPLIDMGNNSTKEVITMEKAVLKDYVKDAHQKFIYVFDYINDRGFKLELETTKSEAPNMYYPICTDFKGDVPPQIGSKISNNSIIFDDNEDEEFNSLHLHKPMHILDEDIYDIDDVSIDKDIESSLYIDLDEEFDKNKENFDEEIGDKEADDL